MTIDYLTTCGICNRPFSTYTGLSHHLGQEHKGITRKEYYDRFLKKPGEGICARCGKPTKFSDRLNRGYYAHCSQKCTATAWSSPRSAWSRPVSIRTCPNTRSCCPGRSTASTTVATGATCGTGHKSYSHLAYATICANASKESRKVTGIPLNSAT